MNHSRMGNQTHTVYQQNAFQTASPGELTLMLYNGCLKFIRLGEQAMKTNDHETKNINITKAQKIVRELMVTLRAEDETTQQMQQLYDFTYDTLVRANIQNNLEVLREAEMMITEFRDTWKEVIKLDRKQRHGSGVYG